MVTSDNKPSRLPAALGGVVVTVFLAGLLGLISANELQKQQNLFAEELFSILRAVDRDIVNILVPLNDLEHQECSPENLLEMEKVLFDSTFAKHIMFYVDDIGVCSTGTGIFDNPIQRPPPDFIGPGGLQLEIWVNRQMILNLTGEPYTAIILKKDNYSIMLDPDSLKPAISTPFEWMFFFRDPADGNQVNIMGNQALLADGGVIRTGYLLKNEMCSREFPYYCLVLASKADQFLGDNKQLITLMLTFCLAIGYISSMRIDSVMQNRIKVPARIANGFRNNAYHWLYQPIVDLNTGAIIGCEVLSRFQDRFGILNPVNFLSEIRNSGRTAEFTKKMFNSVLDEIEPIAGIPSGFKVSFNIFPYDIITGDINEIIALPAIRKSRFKITLEITEDEHLDEKMARENLNKVHQSGLQISIDDFGTGYSNLKQLRKLNSQYLKIDRSYVMELENTPIRASLIPHIVKMAEQLDLQVIAEGIETAQQRDILKNLGVRFGQGWLFGRPMAARELVAMLNTDPLSGQP